MARSERYPRPVSGSRPRYRAERWLKTCCAAAHSKGLPVCTNAFLRHQPPGEPPSFRLLRQPRVHDAPAVGPGFLNLPERVRSRRLGASSNGRPRLASRGRGRKPAVDRVPWEPEFPTSSPPRGRWFEHSSTPADHSGGVEGVSRSGSGAPPAMRRGPLRDAGRGSLAAWVAAHDTEPISQSRTLRVQPNTEEVASGARLRRTSCRAYAALRLALRGEPTTRETDPKSSSQGDLTSQSV